MKKILIALGAIALTILWACHLNPDDGMTKLNVEGDVSWLDFSRLVIEIRDESGNVVDTVFDSRLSDLDGLKGLPSEKYRGGVAVFNISGYEGGILVFSQTRRFDESTGAAVVETTFVAGAKIKTFKATSDSLTLYVGGGDTSLSIDIAPKFARPPLEWKVEGDALELTAKSPGFRAVLKPIQAGKAMITVSPKGADSLVLRIPVRVALDVPKLEVSPAKLFIVPGKSVEFTVKSHQEFGSLVRFEWDLDGDGTWDDASEGPWAGKDVDLPGKSRAFEKAGKYAIRFRVKDSEGNVALAEALVEAGERRPSVELLPKDTVISIRDEVKFRAEIIEPGGKLAEYSWDWNGDGKAEDAATLTDSMTSLKVSRIFQDSGKVKVILRTKDSEGKVGADSVTVTIRQDPPVPEPGAAITAKSNAPVSFAGTAAQQFGAISIYKWDFDGDGVYDDSTDAPPAMTHAYAIEKEYLARFYVRDDDGNVATATRKVTISDVPFVITGKRADTTVSIKDAVPMTASIRNEDGKALQYSWDYNGDGKYDDTATSSLTAINVSVPHIYASAGNFKARFRVQDSQGKALLDSIAITVVVDAPIANLGKDDTVLVGEQVPIKLQSSQKFGTILKREIQVDESAWIPLSNQDTVLTMPMAKGVVRVIGRVTDDDAQIGLDTLNIVVNFPSDNKLSGIFLSAGALAPAFNADTLAYAVPYAYNVTSVIVGGAARDPKASVTVNGTALTASITSVTVLLKPGANSVPIVVTAQDTASKRTYLLTLTRAQSPVSALASLVPSSDALSPKFAAATVSYTLAVSDSVDTVRFTPTVADTQARVTVAGQAVSSGTLSQKIPAQLAPAKYDIVVTAGTGAKTTYSVTVYRKGWALVGARSFAGTKQGLQCIAADKGSAYVGVIDTAVLRSPVIWKWDSAWTNIVPAMQDSGAPGMAIDVIGGVPWMAAISYPTGSSSFYCNVRKFNGASWTLMGKTIPSAYGSSDISLDHDKANLPYVAYHHSYIQQQHFIFKFADTAWTMLGQAGALDSVSNLRMVVNRATGQPAVAFARLPTVGGSNKGVVSTHNGTSYSSLGTVGPVAPDRVDLAFDSLGAAYYAYIDPVSKKAAVRKYTSSWINLGLATGFSDGDASSISVALIGTTPIVAYRDAKLATVVVKRWNGSAWVGFGDANFPIGDAGTVRLAVDNTGVWVAFSEAGGGNKVSVMRRPLP
ncbi:MAG: hypothetical protein JWP91_1178 [Fibrobacteres bacterium]|nr:hypothetical protein [Fibrobacterota bacterium]